jgi:hypothetical protein
MPRASDKIAFVLLRYRLDDFVLRRFFYPKLYVIPLSDFRRIDSQIGQNGHFKIERE